MDVQSVTALISSVGFPIVAYFCMLFLYKNESEKHAEETRQLTEAITSLKEMLQDLKDSLKE